MLHDSARQRNGVAAIFVALFSLLPALSSVAETPNARSHVLILGFANGGASPALAAACAAASGVLDLTMRQLAGYELLPPVPKAAGADIGTLRGLAAQYEADFILFGNMGTDGSGRFACELSLFDRAKGAVSVSRRAEGLEALELFDSTDELVAQVLGEMTGRHIGFGRIEFRNGGEKGSYRVLLDDLAVGSDLASLGNVLVGEHRIRVLQDRILGEYTLLDRTFSIEEGGSLECDFAAPAITDAERSKLEGLESEVRSAWYKAELAGKVEEEVLEYGRLAKAAKYSSAFGEYRRRSSQLAGEWKVARNRAEIESRAWAPSSSLFDPSMSAYLEASRYPNPEAIKAAAQENALLLAELLELAAGKELGEGNARGALSRIESILEFSRCLPAEYRTAYTYAASSLAEIIRTEGDEAAKEKLAPAFGPSIESASAFYGTKPGAGEKVVLPSRCGMRVFDERNKVPSALLCVAASQEAVKIGYEGGGIGGAIGISTDDRRFILVDFGPTSFGLATIASRYPELASGEGKGYCAIVVRSGGEQGDKVAIRILDGPSGEERARGVNSVSALLPPGKYRVLASLAADEGVGYEELVDLGEAQERRIDLPKLNWSPAHERVLLEASRDKLLAKRGNAKRYGAYSLTSLGVGIASFILGECAGPAMGDAYTAYKNSTSADDAVAYRNKTEFLRVLVYTAIVVGVPSLVAAPVFVLKWDKASKVDKQIAALDEQIKRLSGKELGK